MSAPEKDYSSISPSAKSLLWMKALTNIPFAREAAEWLLRREEADRAGHDLEHAGFWARVLHFESRYWSINQLLADRPARNVLELSAGFSFRGLATVMERDVCYLDTDLPDVVRLKKEFLASLPPSSSPPKGTLEILPLNALDADEMSRIAERFPAGELAIVNEGLLLYLEDEEKKTVCANIHRLLQQRGGCWITGDIYVKNRYTDVPFKLSDREREFFVQHRIEENKFESFAQAEEFFQSAGFAVDRVATLESEKLSVLPKFLALAPPNFLETMKSRGRIQETWRLRLA
jgi:O-methyltransferase involved in polyketide biosynthesis